MIELRQRVVGYAEQAQVVVTPGDDVECGIMQLTFDQPDIQFEVMHPLGDPVDLHDVAREAYVERAGQYFPGVSVPSAGARLLEGAVPTATEEDPEEWGVILNKIKSEDGLPAFIERLKAQGRRRKRASS